MSKYNALWQYVAASDGESVVLTFAEIASIIGKPIDHSFLQYKKELSEYGWEVEKIFVKEQKVKFKKC